MQLSYSFRIRFNRPQTKAFLLDTRALAVPVHDKRLSILLLASNDLPFRDAHQMALIGSGYESADEADMAGKQFQNALIVALARVRLGADFGLRTAPTAFLFQYGLKLFEEKLGQKVLPDDHGLMIFPSSPDPRFVSLNAEVITGASPEEFLTALKKVFDLQPQIKDRDLFAYTLFNASYFQPAADARFLLLVMAIEALLELPPRSMDAQKHVNSLIEQTKISSLKSDEIKSIVGSLNWLLKESINQTGQRLATERLGNRVYGDRIAADFFKYCYKLRSRLVHGTLPVPTLEEIRSVVAPLEVFVSDLLTVPILGNPQQ